jgi:hemerythrin-like domain-containing protein
MQARGLLMIEHRLIERMISQLKSALDHISQEGSIDPHFIDTAADFVRTYADRTHHGKEEDILFRALESRPLSDNDRRVMGELVREHIFGRQKTHALVDANDRYRNGDRGALADISEALHALVDFYPKHIQKEDKLFFPVTRAYFTEDEDMALLASFNEFDRNMIHEKYRSVVKSMEQGKGGPSQSL